MMHQLSAMTDAWTQPLLAALYRADRPAVAAALAAAAEAHASLPAAPDTAALQVYLCWLRCLPVLPAEAPADDDAQPRSMLLAELEQLERQAAGPEAEREMRAGVLLNLRCAADLQGWRPLTQDVAAELAAQFPAAGRDTCSWSFLSGWAFHNGFLEPLFEAYTEFLVRRKRTLTRYNWERMRLMYLLLAGQGIFRDVEAVIDKFPHITQARMFGRHIKPRCEEMGVWDERLQMKFELRLIDLEDREPELPAGPAVLRYALNWDGPEIDTKAASSSGDAEGG